MTTGYFLIHYLRETAKVTICNTEGSIIYEGQLGEMPSSLLCGSIINQIRGLGSSDDIIIEIEQVV